MPIDITWNLFSTPIVVMILGVMIKKWMTTERDLHEERHARYREEFAKVNRCLESIKADLNKKVDSDTCRHEHDQVWAAVDRIRDKGGARS